MIEKNIKTQSVSPYASTNIYETTCTLNALNHLNHTSHEPCIEELPEDNFLPDPKNKNKTKTQKKQFRSQKLWKYTGRADKL